ncbi:Hydrogen cyanide synthase subunit HcnA [Nonomuraea coxensis DSM 45129]|uniref:Hydrogen cyanide synthase subunit HcnA n=1 Tax=Nonomuraea coxensis DSM 45129 TaxID=1122611 RepID=A0ABX8U0G9_9ACTN|nr:(2Fe-2S)-binding protein [Nonomuraea coxensis]QYC41033.1 Hydrogen cyanide synthase subunit HcnA [Nonomuraea coxensis DSM 45129]
MTYRMTFRGAAVPAEPGQSVGAALVAAGIRDWRTTRRGGRPRGLFCGIGVCFDCLITVNGIPDLRACLTPAADGLHLTPTPETPTREDPTPEDPAPEDPAPEGAAAEGPAPKDVAPKDVAPKDLAPKDVAPKDAASADPAPKGTTLGGGEMGRGHA